MKLKLNKKTLSILAITSIVFLVFVINYSDNLVKVQSEKYLFESVSEIPKNKVGLLLGTGKFLSNGNLNKYYTYRIDATIKLFENGKIEYILVSGDNSRKDYDEPSTMKNDLINAGIPSSKIFLDYAGFRTLDSVIRSNEVFGQKEITIISQKFHNERAVFISRKKGIAAFGFNAKDVDKLYGFKTQLREKLARVKVLIDLVIDKKPKLLGKKVTIE